MMTMEALIALLDEHGIDPHALAWGSGETRTVDKLLEELNRGECELVSVRHGSRRRLARRTNILMQEVYVDLRTGKRLALVETAHVRNLDTFASPKSFVDRKLDVTITEKAMVGETAFEVAKRALCEELRIEALTEEDCKHLYVSSVGEIFEPTVGATYLSQEEGRALLSLLEQPPNYPPWRPQQTKYIGVYESVSYPALLTESKAHWITYVMHNREQFALGYHDRDGNKLTTYDWRDPSTRSRR